jgi:hypothetical protein
MPEALSPALIETTTTNLRDLLKRLEEDKANLENRIAEVKDTIARLDRQLRSTSQPDRTRRRKGENLRLILSLYEEDPEASFSIQEMAEKAHLPVSSAQVAVKAALKRKPPLLRKDDFDGRFTKTQPAQEPLEEEAPEAAEIFNHHR